MRARKLRAVCTLPSDVALAHARPHAQSLPRLLMAASLRGTRRQRAVEATPAELTAAAASLVTAATSHTGAVVQAPGTTTRCPHSERAVSKGRHRRAVGVHVALALRAALARPASDTRARVGRDAFAVLMAALGAERFGAVERAPPGIAFAHAGRDTFAARGAVARAHGLRARASSPAGRAQARAWGDAGAVERAALVAYRLLARPALPTSVAGAALGLAAAVVRALAVGGRWAEALRARLAVPAVGATAHAWADACAVIGARCDTHGVEARGPRPAVVAHAAARRAALAVATAARRADGDRARGARPAVHTRARIRRLTHAVRATAVDAHGLLTRGALPARLARTDAGQLTRPVRAARARRLRAQVAAPAGLARQLAVDAGAVGAAQASAKRTLTTVAHTVGARDRKHQLGHAIDH